MSRVWTLPAVGGPFDGQPMEGIGRRRTVSVGPLTGEYRRVSTPTGSRWEWRGPLPADCVAAMQKVARETPP